ncbi:MAG: hypothetical protein K2M65_05665, partial [Muribaculaceae bacterium]|nr:hypothetical protein [Muribaculaceae bacterium]
MNLLSLCRAMTVAASLVIIPGMWAAPATDAPLRKSSRSMVDASETVAPARPVENLEPVKSNGSSFISAGSSSFARALNVPVLKSGPLQRRVSQSMPVFGIVIHSDAWSS